MSSLLWQQGDRNLGVGVGVGGCFWMRHGVVAVFWGERVAPCQLTINRQQPQHRGGRKATVFGQRRVKLAAMAFTLLWQMAALLCHCNAVTVPWHGSSVAMVTMWQRLSLQGATAIEKVNEND